MKNKVILVFPGRKVDMSKLHERTRIPLPLLQLAETLQKTDFKIKLLDMRVEDYKTLNLDDTICVGISVRTDQISQSLEFAKWIREKNPSIPIIWGGIHPSILPAQTIQNEYVDIIVRGEGELTFLELVKKLEAEESIEDIKGITYKQDNQIKTNPDREFTNMDNFGPLPYHLLNLEKYPKIKESFDFQSSRGCPHNCGFCYTKSFNKCCWRSKSAEKVLEELKIIKEKFNPEQIVFIDDNFLVNQERGGEIAKGMKELGFRWTAGSRYDYFEKYDDNFLKLLKESNCEYVGFGAESGSEKVLGIINKGITPNQIMDATRRCKELGITSATSFIIGHPGETKEDLYQTLSIISKLKEIDPNVIIEGAFTLMIYPGTSFFEIAKQYENFVYPQTLEEWGNWDFTENILPWEKNMNKLRTISNIARFRYIYGGIEAYSKEVKRKKFKNIFFLTFYNIFSFLLKTDANFRWKYRFFKFGIEWKLFKAVYRFFSGHT